MNEQLKVAIVGGGPRGIAVTEQLILSATDKDIALSVDVYDDRMPGAGRIWNPHQSPLLLMNTHSREVTIFSGEPDQGPTRAGSGPSLQQWIEATGITLEIDGYAPRAVYGAYLSDSFLKITRSTREGICVRGVSAFVRDISQTQDGFLVYSDAKGCSRYHAVILATGHPQQKPSQVVNKDHATFIEGDSAADLDLDHIRAGETVATIGMGLSFHDIVSLLTLGRGGEYRDKEGTLTYRPSGAEPTIVGISRSGLPIPSRGLNQKPADHTFEPLLCTDSRVASLRDRGILDFARDVEPWIAAEATASYVTTYLRNENRSDAVQDFRRQAMSIESDPLNSIRSVASAFGISKLLPSLYELARPFQGKTYRSFGEWSDELRSYISQDIDSASKGNVDNPTKAALDTLRDLRPAVRTLVENGGLDPASHENDFLGKFVPAYSLMVAGPPLQRNRQLLALMASGVVKVAPPSTRVIEEGPGRYHLECTTAPWSVEVTRVIDARIPTFRVGTCMSSLYPNLLGRGLVRRYRHFGSDRAIETGACEFDPHTARTIDIMGNPVPGLCIIGIPTERQKWFTQVGNGRPGVKGGFYQEAKLAADTALSDAARNFRRILVSA